MKIKVPSKAIAAVAKAAGKIKQYSPQIMMAAGTITAIAAMVEAIKQTPKAKDIIDTHKDEIEKYNEVLEEHPDEYSMQDYKKDVTRLCLITSGKLVKTYAMPLAMEAASLVCFFGAHKIMADRNKLLSAALAATTDAYNSYRNKMVEALGEEKEEQIRLGTTNEKITKEVVDPETGKTKKVTERITTFDPKNLGPYDILWTEGDRGFDQSESIRNMTKASVATMFTKMIYTEHLADKVCLAQITEYFKGKKEAWSNQTHIVAGYSKDDADQEVIISSRPVMVKDPDTGYFLDGEVLSFNVQGSIVPTFVK